MMRSIFAVLDVVAGEMFGPFILQPNEAAARRLFQDALTGQGSAMASHPDDYALFFLGEFDSETGLFSQDGAGFSSVPLVTGGDVLRAIELRRQADADASEDRVRAALESY